MGSPFTAQQRRKVKHDSRACVWDNIGRCIGIQILCAVPYVLLLVILYATLFGRVFALLAAGYTDNYILGSAAAEGLNSVWGVLFVMLVITGPLQYGLMRFYVSLRRGGEPGTGTLFQAFTSLQELWTGIKMAFCLFFRSLLWTVGPTLLYMFALMAITINTIVTRQAPPAGLMTGIGVLYGLAMLLINVKLLAYRAGWVVLYDHPDCSVWDATAHAGRAFLGQFGRLLLFALSFIGWYILLAGITGVCLFLGLLGWRFFGGAMGVAVLAAVLLAVACLYIVLGSFINAYFTTSFIGVYETLAEPQGEAGPRTSDGGENLQ